VTEPAVDSGTQRGLRGLLRLVLTDTGALRRTVERLGKERGCARQGQPQQGAYGRGVTEPAVDSGTQRGLRGLLRLVLFGHRRAPKNSRTAWKGARLCPSGSAAARCVRERGDGTGRGFRNPARPSGPAAPGPNGHRRAPKNDRTAWKGARLCPSGSAAARCVRERGDGTGRGSPEPSVAFGACCAWS
jgi:hypothetical protein